MTAHIVTHAKTLQIGKTQNVSHRYATHLERAQGI
jgi:predicted GIY-YIG superfamily endonuclease